ncbi:transposon ty3-G gag-pol polyprotein [Tanacetum coccineum]
MIKLRGDVELKDTLVVVIPNLKGEGYSRSTIRVQYEWKPLRCSNCKVFGHVLDTCPKKSVADVSKNLQKPRQAPCGHPIGMKPKSNFVYRLVQHTSNTSASKKRAEVPRQEVNNSTPFDAFNSMENDVELDTNGGISNSVDKGNVNGSSSNIPIIEKIDKIERRICEGKLRFLDDDGNPFVPTGNVDSDSEVKVVFNETTNLKVSMSGKDRSDKCYSTKSLLE